MKKNKAFTKRIVVFALLIVTLSGAVYINWRYGAADGSLNLTAALSGEETTTGAAADDEGEETYLGQAELVNADGQDNYFRRTIQNRKETRENSLEELREVMNNARATEEARLVASEQIAHLTTVAERESAIETLIEAKGFSESVAVLAEDSISVVVRVPQDGLAPNQAAQIHDIIRSNVDISAENIRIVEIK